MSDDQIRIRFDWQSLKFNKWQRKFVQRLTLFRMERTVTRIANFDSKKMIPESYGFSTNFKYQNFWDKKG